MNILSKRINDIADDVKDLEKNQTVIKQMVNFTGKQ